MLPSLDELLDGARRFRIPLRVQFRGTDVREGVLLRGPCGWGEFAPFPEYGVQEAARWLAAAVEAGWQGWPDAVRSAVAVNAIVPAVEPELAVRLVRESGCSTVKVKVAEHAAPLGDDVARVAAVREAVGSAGKVRVDANGAWSVREAAAALQELARFDLEYVEQPCATLEQCAELRGLVDVSVAVDEGLRKADDPLRVKSLREAADVLILKVPPLGGVGPALQVAKTYGLPCTVSSALDTSVGLAAGLALAAALPELPYACGLGSGFLLSDDVSDERVLPAAGWLTPGISVRVDVGRTSPLDGRWRQRLAAAHHALGLSTNGQSRDR